MKLRTKGFLVVCIPLVFQIVTVSVLAFLLWRAQVIATHEADAKDVAYECNNLIVQIGNVMIQAGFGDNRPNTDATRKIEQQSISKISKTLVTLEGRLREVPEEATNLNSLDIYLRQFISNVKAAREAEFSHDPEVHDKADILEFKSMYGARKLIHLIKNIAVTETQTHPDNPETRNQARALIRNWLVVAVLLTVLLALGLAYLCSVTIRKPLERMAKNALRISTREPLEAPMTGSDELSELDRKLHRVNESIEEALTSERNMINYAADLVFSIDRQGIFLSVNPFCKSMLGSEPDELIGTSVLEVVPAEVRNELKNILASSYKGRESLQFEMRMQGRTGAIDTSWSVIYSQRDRTFFCVAHDITERKHVEQLKQDFIAMISHDLRTPLMSVSSSINLVQSGATGEINEVIEKELNSAERSVDHLIELVNDLLDFEKLEAGRMSFEILPLPINTILDESVRLVQALAEERKVKVEIISADQVVSGDERKLIQVTVNLLSNALKHSPEQSTIKVQTRINSVDMIEVSIHDQGPGVPDEYVEKIFAPFEQIAHRPTAALGTGLGLAICKLIVEGLGGKISVRHSELLGGSAFWYTLPRADSQTTESPTVTSVALR
ncbi:MAG TPA: ATP-binding protein [Drouetiella sp.]